MTPAPDSGREPTPIQALRRRKLAQWLLAYAAGAWIALQVTGLVADSFEWPRLVMRLGFGVAMIGLAFALVLAWYHGERGIQRATRSEIILLVLVSVVGTTALWRLVHASAVSDDARAAARAVSATGVTAKAPAASATSIDQHSIAVLPLANESGDADQQYFSDGLSEDLITALSQFGGLKVISRNSSFQFRDASISSASIGTRLGVAHLLEGSVRRVGDTVRISAALVKAADGSTLWSQHYDRPYRDLFKLQDEITNAVAGELKLKLLAVGAGVVVQTDRPPSGNLDAYNAYLQGAYLIARNTDADYLKAVDFFNRAIAIDPQYAYAYAALGIAWTVDAAQFQGGEAARQANAKSRQAIDKALALAPDLAFAHVARGQLLINGSLNWVEAETEFQRALVLSPNDSQATSLLGVVKATLGDLDAGIALTNQALRINPLDADSHYWLSYALGSVGQLDASERAIRKAIELQPTAYHSYVQLTVIDVLRGRHAAAIATAIQMEPGGWGDIARAYARQNAGDPQAADAALKVLLDTAAFRAAYQIAQVYALRKDPDRMFAWLERAWTNRDPGLRRLLYDPFLAPYRQDPRFAAFCAKVGLPAPMKDAR